MKILAVFLLFAACVLPAVSGRLHKYHNIWNDNELTEDSLREKFLHFKERFNRQYASAAHEDHRYNVFAQNMRTAHKLAHLNPSATFGLNAYSDIHPEEFRRSHRNFRPIVDDRLIERANHKVRVAEVNGALPDNFDWRAPGSGKPVGVTAVKDQGQCGSCWAFSATEGVESAYILAGNSPVALAPEQTVDCDTVDQGCNGGDLPTAFEYMQANGVQSEASYPYQAGYTGSAGPCKYDKSKVVAKISGFVYATPSCNDTCSHQDEEALKASVFNHGPASICVDASVWQFYTGGILTPSSGCSSDYNSLDHCVQLVGWGTDSASKKQFWSVRNSWATSWGEQGYIRLAYGSNTCGVADEATQVQIA